jgi:hypothetical protein
MNPPFRRRGKFVLTTGFQMAFDTYCSSYTGPRKVATQNWSPSLVHLAKPPDGKGKEGLGIIYSSMARCAKWGTYLKWSFLLMMIPRKGGMIFYFWTHGPYWTIRSERVPADPTWPIPKVWHLTMLLPRFTSHPLNSLNTSSFLHSFSCCHFFITHFEAWISPVVGYSTHCWNTYICQLVSSSSWWKQTKTCLIMFLG